CLVLVYSKEDVLLPALRAGEIINLGSRSYPQKYGQDAREPQARCLRSNDALPECARRFCPSVLGCRAGGLFQLRIGLINKGLVCRRMMLVHRLRYPNEFVDDAVVELGRQNLISQRLGVAFSGGIGKQI